MSEQQGIDVSGGYIKIFRSLSKHWLWSDPVKLQWWIDILFEVNYEPKKVLLGNTLVTCNRGQVLYSQDTWAKRWRVNRSMVRRFLQLLESDGIIVTESVAKTTRITICKYESYNDWRPGDDHETTTLRPNGDHLATTTEEGKESKERKKGVSTKPEKRKQAFVPPTEDEVIAYFKENQYNETTARRAFKHYHVAEWHDANGNKVRNWKQKMVSVWFKPENKIKEVPGSSYQLFTPTDENQW